MVIQKVVKDFRKFNFRNVQKLKAGTKNIKKRKSILLFYPRLQFYQRFFSFPLKSIKTNLKHYTYILNKTSKKFILYKRRKYFLLDKLTTNQGRFSTRKHPRFKLTPQQYFFRKWKRSLVRDEISSRYYFFNKIKAPLLARVVYGPVLLLLVKIIKVDFLKFLTNYTLPKYNLSVTIKFLNNFNISASIILHYLLARLDLLYLPREIIPKLLNRLFPRKFIGRRAFNRNKHKVGFVKKPLVRGIMFKCAGRFSRAQMASYQVYKQGCMPLSTIKHNIKYAFGTVSLKYGSLGLKVFIFG